MNKVNMNVSTKEWGFSGLCFQATTFDFVGMKKTHYGFKVWRIKLMIGFL